MRLIKLAGVILGAAMLAGPAMAQETPREIQGQIATGHAREALGNLQTVIASHPDSGTAWYLTAEAQDALGNSSAARDALTKAEQFSPGLPFAKPADVSALQAHLAASSPVSGAATGGFSMHPVLFVFGALVLMFLLVRVFARRRVAAGYPQPYGQPMQPTGGYGPQAGPYGQAPGMGGGLGSSIVSGLAAGAGFAAGEQIIDRMVGGGERGQGNPFGGDASQVPPLRDDGLQGDPGWDDNAAGGGLDDNNNW